MVVRRAGDDKEGVMTSHLLQPLLITTCLSTAAPVRLPTTNVLPVLQLNYTIWLGNQSSLMRRKQGGRNRVKQRKNKSRKRREREDVGEEKQWGEIWPQWQHINTNTERNINVNKPTNLPEQWRKNVTYSGVQWWALSSSWCQKRCSRTKTLMHLRCERRSIMATLSEIDPKELSVYPPWTFCITI